MSAQKAVEELSSKGVLDKRGLKGKLQGMKNEALLLFRKRLKNYAENF
jgi:hypothetical protein